jgi:heat shock protein HslJ
MLLHDGRIHNSYVHSNPWLWVALLAVVSACTPPQRSELSPAAFRTAVAGTDWELHQLNGGTAPIGAGGRRATIRFDADTTRVAGFAGCNRYFASYALDGEVVRFSQIGMTRMACAEGMELEQQLAKALEATRRYRIADHELELLDEAGSVARFVRPSKP